MRVMGEYFFCHSHGASTIRRSVMDMISHASLLSTTQVYVVERCIQFRQTTFKATVNHLCVYMHCLPVWNALVWSTAFT